MIAEIEQPQTASKTLFGFWLYLMTDCLLFASLFATYVVLKGNIHDGPGPHEIFNMPFVLAETIILLTSSFACGLMLLAAKAGNVRRTKALLGGIIALGGLFLAMELSEFAQLAHEGANWTASAFLSAFFTLVGTHGAHIFVGILWAVALLWLLVKRPLNAKTLQKLSMFGMFWHFLDVIWIFIFTVVYLMGVV